MIQSKKLSEAYWNSYKLLESHLLRLSHSICFDDNQIKVYSSELADIINSACIKIESIAKDIYEEHIWPFQTDEEIVPKSYTDGRYKRNADKYSPEKWTRNKWKYDYHCLLEIDIKYSLCKKRVKLKGNRFHFLKYGPIIMPFGNLSLADCKGGYWEYSEKGSWNLETQGIKKFDWCKSYQAIKHNYIQSIPAHGTVGNAIMVLAAFYLLAVLHSCLPFRQFEIEGNEIKREIDFGSELFSCDIKNSIIPPCIVDSVSIQLNAERKEQAERALRTQTYEEQTLLNDTEGIPFLITLNDRTYSTVKKLVDDYCIPRGLESFDIAPYKDGSDLVPTEAGVILYRNLQKYIRPPYQRSNICISFNSGSNHVYGASSMFPFEYERTKYARRTKAVLSNLKVGDYVKAKFFFDDDEVNGEVLKLTEHMIELSVRVGDSKRSQSEPIASIIYIRKEE